jgi:hypothetical protein
MLNAHITSGAGHSKNVWSRKLWCVKVFVRYA